MRPRGSASADLFRPGAQRGLRSQPRGDWCGGESVRPRSPCGGRFRCQTHISTLQSNHSCSHAAQQSLQLLENRLHRQNLQNIPGAGHQGKRIIPSSGELIRRRKNSLPLIQHKVIGHEQMHPVTDPTEVDRSSLIQKCRMTSSGHLLRNEKYFFRSYDGSCVDHSLE